MSKLTNIRPYIEKLCNIMASVLEMDVIVADTDLCILGDWEHGGCVSEETESLRDDSVVARAMRESRVIVYNNAKEENEGCRHCPKRKNCNSETIIAYPLAMDGTVVGGIGIYSKEKYQKDKLAAQKTTLTQFIEEMGELLIRQLEEKEQSLELLAANEKMNRVIEILDFALASVDENNRVVYYNQKFAQLLPHKKQLIGEPISRWCKDFTAGDTTERRTNVLLRSGHKPVEYEVTFSPTVINGKYSGALLSFKDASEVLAKASQLLYPTKHRKFDEIIGSSDKIRRAKQEAASFAHSRSNILITGESGTGKEVFATAIHNASRCADGPFIAVNCAAIPDNLLESELFGYEEGAFTGAAKGGRAGKFEIANKGTLFLDEIGELPIHLQPKLLRALQEKKIQRVGSNRSISIDIRIIAATNKNLTKMMETGEFRSDLYYRLSVIPIQIPALRERREDIPVLSAYFLQMYSSMLEKSGIVDFDSETMEILRAYDWPGNVRELQNTIEYAVNKCSDRYIHVCDIPERFQKQERPVTPPTPLKDLEKAAIYNAVAYYGNTPEGKEKAADAIGISRATMYRKIKEYQLLWPQSPSAI